MFFNIATCPTGWSALTTAQGRYLVGLPASGTLAGTQGTQLSNLENRAVGQHTHALTDPGHAHAYERESGAYGLTGTGKLSSTLYANYTTGATTTGITINNAGTVIGTNAPYVQLLVCQKD